VSSLIGFAVRRLLETVPTLLLLSVLVFALFKLIPGDYLSEMEMNPSISKSTVAALRSDFGLNRSLPEQYGLWVVQAVRGNLGYSFAQRRPALDVISERLGRTIYLTLVALLLSLAWAVPAALLGALRLGRWPDRLVLVLSLVGMSIPTVLSSLILLWFALGLGWSLFSTGGPGGVLLPAVTLAVPAGALFARTLRLELVSVLGQPFAAAAVAQGLPRRRVLLHVLRNAANPLISLVGLTLGGLLSGAVVVEKVFSWPGLGALTVDSILARDLYVALGAVLVSACFVVLANFLADVLLALNDPRVRE
jgi:peptide/nickel transport system permease protein